MPAMPHERKRGAHREAAQARSALYLDFATAFAHPKERRLGARLQKAKGESPAEWAARLPYAIDLDTTAFAALDDDTQTEDLNTRYTSTFEIGNAPISLREGTYVSKSLHSLYEDLFRFYEHFGLDFSTSGLRQAPDFLGVELEFMHYLTFLEAGTDEAAALRRAQLDFLSRHLMAWIPALVTKIEAQAALAPYDDIAKALLDFTTSECAWLAA